jgi:hypothetical protein
MDSAPLDPPCCLSDDAPAVAAWCEGWGLVEQSQAGAMPPERIRYRLIRLQRVLPVLPFAVLVVGLDTWRLTSEPFGSEIAMSFGMWAGLLSGMLILGRYFGITLTESTAIVHNLRRRTIQWSNVQAIRVEPFQGTRTVVIYEAGGRRTRLRAPLTGFLNWDRSFEEKFHTIGRWWLEHRGPDWAPVPPPEAWRDGRPAPDGNPFAPPT